jgi:hypothetical protein
MFGGSGIKKSPSNLLASSGDLSVSPWVLDTQADISFVSINSLGFSEYKLVEKTTTSGTHSVKQTLSAITTGTQLSVWVVAKLAERDKLNIFFQTATTGNPACRFDLTNGTVAVTTSANSVDKSIISLGGGYYRCGMTAIADASASPVIQFRIMNASNAGTYAGTVGNGILLSAPYAYLGALQDYRYRA